MSRSRRPKCPKGRNCGVCTPVELLDYRRRRDELHGELDIEAAVNEYEDTYNGRALDYIQPVAHELDAAERHHRGRRRDQQTRASDRRMYSWKRQFARLPLAMQLLVRSGRFALQQNLDGGWALVSRSRLLCMTLRFQFA